MYSLSFIKRFHFSCIQPVWEYTTLTKCSQTRPLLKILFVWCMILRHWVLRNIRPLKVRHYVSLKHQRPLTPWCSIMFQKNRILAQCCCWLKLNKNNWQWTWGPTHVSACILTVTYTWFYIFMRAKMFQALFVVGNELCIFCPVLCFLKSGDGFWDSN